MRLLLAALVLSTPLAAVAQQAVPPAIESAWQPALSAGYGAAYDAAGLGLELRRGHFAGFVAIGSDFFAGPPDSGPRGRSLGSVALGARWFSGEGDHLVLSVHATGTSWDGWQTHNVGSQGRALLGATAGWRQKIAGSFFAQAGLGAAAQYQRYDVQLASAAPVAGWSLVPNLDAALGMTF